MLDIQRNGNIGYESKEYNFWDEKRIKKYDKHADSESSDLEFQTKINECDVYSPTFWATNTRHEASKLLQHIFISFNQLTKLKYFKLITTNHIHINLITNATRFFKFLQLNLIAK